MDDNSDWWSLLRDVRQELPCSPLSKEKPNAANFVIAGVDLRHAEPIRDAEEKVAKTSEKMTRGDAATGRTQICFKSASEKGRFKLIFEEGAGGLPSVAYLIDGGPDWPQSYKCVVSQKISNKLATASGLHLEMTAAEVEKILSKPCIVSNDSIEYALTTGTCSLWTSDNASRPRATWMLMNPSTGSVVCKSNSAERRPTTSRY